MNTHDHKDENTAEKCWLCKGYGVLPPHTVMHRIVSVLPVMEPERQMKETLAMNERTSENGWQ